jgi:hypothetical protein
MKPQQWRPHHTALKGLTSGFGMGTGVSLLQLSPGEQNQQDRTKDPVPS